MRFPKLPSLFIALALLSACSTEKVVTKAPPPPPEPVVVIQPLISLEIAKPVLAKKRGPVGANIEFTNTSSDTIQYILFKTTAYDRSGNIVKARKSRDHSAYLRVAGPISPGEYSSGHSWTNTWRHKGVHCLDVEQVEIIYLDGSIEVASGEKLAKLETDSCSS